MPWRLASMRHYRHTRCSGGADTSSFTSQKSVIGSSSPVNTSFGYACRPREIRKAVHHLQLVPEEVLAQHWVEFDPSEPIGIVEELLSVALSIQRLEPGVLGRERALQLTEADPHTKTHTEYEGQEALRDAFAIAGLEPLLKEALEARRQALEIGRQRMRCNALHEQMEEQEGAQRAEWLASIDELTPGGFDLLTMTALHPTRTFRAIMVTQMRYNSVTKEGHDDDDWSA